MCKLALRVWLFFAKKHYVCVVCGAASGTPDALCYPTEREFEQ